MLIRFNVRNYLSYDCKEDGTSEEFSMIAGKVRKKSEHIYDDGNLKLLKFAAVYGANASGKSNLVKALDFMKKTVINRLPDNCTEQYCKVKPENKQVPSYFEVEVLLNGKYYAYGFEVILNEGRFTSEWLVELLSNGADKSIFSRNIETGEFDFGAALKNSQYHEKLKTYAEDIKNDGEALFLKIMNQNKKELYAKASVISILNDMYKWFKMKLVINFPDAPLSTYSYLKDKEQAGKIYDIISAFGTGISGFNVENLTLDQMMKEFSRSFAEKFAKDINKELASFKQDSDAKALQGRIRFNDRLYLIYYDRESSLTCSAIQFTHGENGTLFNIGEESNGTVRLMELLEILLDDRNKTFVVDELDRCLHPSLTYKFVETYLRLAAEKDIQLIATTHEARLMDFNLLRRDEIWFVNKRDNGATDIYSLEEYNARFDQKIDKAYLEGRYGGVPVFSTVFPVEG